MSAALWRPKAPGPLWGEIKRQGSNGPCRATSQDRIPGGPPGGFPGGTPRGPRGTASLREAPRGPVALREAPWLSARLRNTLRGCARLREAPQGSTRPRGSARLGEAPCGSPRSSAKAMWHSARLCGTPLGSARPCGIPRGSARLHDAPRGSARLSVSWVTAAEVPVDPRQVPGAGGASSATAVQPPPIFPAAIICSAFAAWCSQLFVMRLYSSSSPVVQIVMPT